MNWLFIRTNRIFDTLEEGWESRRGQRIIANVLVVSFIAALILIELSRQNRLPTGLANLIPTNHFYAADFVLRLLLLVELASLVFGLAHSVANSVGKQIEILSLILLRETFKEFTHFAEPILWEQVQPVLLSIVAESVAALLVFVILGFYYRAQRHRPLTADAQGRASFVSTKKLIALGLLSAFIGLGINALLQYLLAGRDVLFFDACYTVLIFADVLLILVSLRYSATYASVFRNSSFTIATILIRISLIAAPPFNALLGVGSAIFALGLTIAYNTFAHEIERARPATAPHVPESSSAPAITDTGSKETETKETEHPAKPPREVTNALE